MSSISISTERNLVPIYEKCLPNLVCGISPAQPSCIFVFLQQADESEVGLASAEKICSISEYLRVSGKEKQAKLG